LKQRNRCCFLTRVKLCLFVHKSVSEKTSVHGPSFQFYWFVFCPFSIFFCIWSIKFYSRWFGLTWYYYHHPYLHTRLNTEQVYEIFGWNTRIFYSWYRFRKKSRKVMKILQSQKNYEKSVGQSTFSWAHDDCKKVFKSLVCIFIE